MMLLSPKDKHLYFKYIVSFILCWTVPLPRKQSLSKGIHVNSNFWVKALCKGYWLIQCWSPISANERLQTELLTKRKSDIPRAITCFLKKVIHMSITSFVYFREVHLTLGPALFLGRTKNNQFVLSYIGSTSSNKTPDTLKRSNNLKAFKYNLKNIS